MKKNHGEKDVEISLSHLARALWKKTWLILLAAVICAGCAFAATRLFIEPEYRARIVLYVNNKNGPSEHQNGISSGDIAASQQLVDTYTVILKTRSTLEEVIERAGVSYDYETLAGMITASPIKKTETFYVLVNSTVPEEAARIANTISEVLPGRISSILDGSSVKIIDPAVVPKEPFSPDVKKNTMLGCVLGIVLSCGFVVVRVLTDSLVHDSDYLTENYDIPILAVIPDLDAPANRGAASGQKSRPGKGGQSHG